MFQEEDAPARGRTRAPFFFLFKFVLCLMICMHSGEKDVTLSLYPHRESPYDLWILMLCQSSYAVSLVSNRVSQLAGHWGSNPKVVGSTLTMARYIQFSACQVWIQTKGLFTRGET